MVDEKKIGVILASMLAALFNAPATTDNHYTMLVNHDFHGGG